MSRSSRPLKARARQRRWVWLLAVLILAIPMAVLSGRWFMYDHRPGLGGNQQYGVDVSHHQGQIDWRAVSNDNIDFAYIKATEGGDWVDPRFVENWEQAQMAGLDVAAYHFFTLCRPGEEQAANFLETVPIREAGRPLALDLEFSAACEDPMSAAELRVNVALFVDQVETVTGEEMLVYLLSDFEEAYAPLDGLDGLDRRRWVRSLYRRPAGEWAVWQYSGRARVDGIDGPVDLNVADD